MSTVGSFDRFLHFSELNSPLFDQTGVLSPSTRKAKASANLGLSLDRAVGGAEIIRNMPAVATATDTATLTTAQVLNGVIHGTPTAAAAYTMPAIAATVAALPDFEVGDALIIRVVNLATNTGFDITMTGGGGTGVTVVGPAVVGAGPADGTEVKFGVFALRKTGAATFDLIRIE